MSENKSSPMVWIAGGCGLLTLLGCCIGGAVGIYFYQKKQEELVYGAFDPGGPMPVDTFGGDAPGPAPLPLMIPAASMPAVTSHTIIATVDRSAGSVTVPVGSMCTFVVEVRAQPDLPQGYWCHTIVMCAGSSLYGGESNGFFPCAVYDNPAAVIGEDGETTGTDSDGSFQLDTRTGRLIVRDDAAGPLGAFRVEAAVQTVL